MNWPWWQVALALVLMVYGGLRRLGVGALAALIGAYFAASLPLANVHVALAGYATCRSRPATRAPCSRCCTGSRRARCAMRSSPHCWLPRAR